ncbi:unconventional prefoldin RPB5 interactor-like [Dermacentor andersoni]|uniref:unconventional prefoldin RPB5 interactor-like n=1 Tax=Dermacentor andersoni TaxID=34620 RepID=UPI002155C6D2|nr:unconventional prefoldin RPB5 interactor-like [Dermacentor andersoni]
MESEQMEKLRQSQLKGLRSCDAKLERWAQFERDYEALSERLRTLPDRVSHEVMVPLNSLAFMPGRLIHTNEVLVLLGDNWFAERSASQALGIAERRAEQCRKMQEGLKAEREQRTNWMKYTDELHRESGYVDIREPYDPAEESTWRERHRKSVRDHHTSKKAAAEQEHQSDTDVWKLLDRLELQEEQEEARADIAPEMSHEEVSRKVRWQDESSGHISFSYSSSDTCSATTASCSSDALLSPGDILRMFGGSEASVAKSILKNSLDMKPPTLPKASVSSPVVPAPRERPKLKFDDAFTGNVVEHRTIAPSSTTIDFDVTDVELPAPLNKPSSLFRSRRVTKP